MDDKIIRLIGDITNYLKVNQDAIDGLQRQVTLLSRRMEIMEEIVIKAKESLEGSSNV